MNDLLYDIAADVDDEGEDPIAFAAVTRGMVRGQRRWLILSIGRDRKVWRGAFLTLREARGALQVTASMMLETPGDTRSTVRLVDPKRARLPRPPISADLRFRVLQRDRHTCRYCGRSAPEVKLHLDHVVPFSKGGASEAENLVTACQDCNLGKHDRELSA